MDMPDIPPALDRRKPKPLVFSYTFLNTYENICAYQCFRRYVKKDIKFTGSDASRFGDDVHKAMELRVGGGKPLPVDFQKWESFAVPFDGLGAKTELQLGVNNRCEPTTFFGDDVRVRGRVDLFVQNGEKAYILDWKTGGSKYEDPFELEIGAMLLKAKYPELASITGSFAWLKEDRLGQRYDLSDTKAAMQKVGGIIKRVEADKASDSWEKKPGGLCGWCDVRDCEHNRKGK